MPKAVGMIEKSSDAVTGAMVTTRSGPKWSTKAAVTFSVVAASLSVSGNDSYNSISGSFGEPDAPVQVLALLPLRTGCQAPRLEYLLQAACSCPNAVRVRFLDFLEPHGRQEAARHHINCAAVLVNGRTDFTLGEPGGREVRLMGPVPDGYTLQDLRSVLQQQLTSAIGDAAPQLPAVSPQHEGGP